MKQPLLSIVIANYNYGRFLEEAIRSVIEQDGFNQCELIIADGGSTDNSVEIIKKYADKIAWWCSEKDKGQSDAFNKGFAYARGRLGCWLNADDIMMPGTIAAVLEVAERRPSIEWVTGGTIFFSDDMKVWRARIGTSVTKKMHKWVDATVIGGPSSFFSIKRLRQVGGFNVALHFTMDCDVWKKFLSSGMLMTHVNRYFWGFRRHQASKTSHAFGGSRSAAFCAEEARQFNGRRFSEKEVRRHVLKLRIYKMLNGSFLRSYIDTRRFAGKDIRDLGL